MTRDEKLTALVERWPNDNGDPPTTDYQSGYMAACRDCAASLAAILAEPDMTGVLANELSVARFELGRLRAALNTARVEETLKAPSVSGNHPEIPDSSPPTPPLDPAVVAELERLRTWKLDVTEAVVREIVHVFANFPGDYERSIRAGRDAVLLMDEAASTPSPEIGALTAMVERLRNALLTYRELSALAFTLLDADRDSKAMKLLKAMAGSLPGYRKETDDVAAAIAAALQAQRGE